MRYLLSLLLICQLFLQLAYSCDQVIETPRKLPKPAMEELSFVSQNLWHFNDEINDTRLRRVAGYVRHSLQSPHFLAVQEVGSHEILQQLADVIKAQGGPQYDTWLIPGPDPGEIHVGVLVRSPLKVADVKQLFLRESTRQHISLFFRPPLLVELEQPKLQVAIIHNRSGIGLPQKDIVQKRRRQAELLHQWVLDNYGDEREMMIVGDLNSHPETDTYGEPYSILNQWPLISMWNDVAKAERFSYIYQCQRQAIDHIFMTPGLSENLQTVAVTRGSAGRYRDLYGSEGTVVLTDHEAVAAYFKSLL